MCVWDSIFDYFFFSIFNYFFDIQIIKSNKQKLKKFRDSVWSFDSFIESADKIQNVWNYYLQWKVLSSFYFTENESVNKV